MWFDPAVVELVRDLAPAWLVVILVIVSFLGSATFITPLLVALHCLEREARTATWLGIVFGSFALRSLLKSLNSVDRPPVAPPIEPEAFPALVRPLYAHPAEIATTSFPSGHVIAATVFWGLIVVDGRLWNRRWRFVVAASIVTIVALSRLVVGAHYLGDVVGGLAIGLVYLAVALEIRRRVSHPVGATVGLAGVLAATILTFSSTTTGEVVLGVSVGMLAAWYWRPVRATIRNPFVRPSRDRLVGMGPILLGLGGGAILLLGGHSVALALPGAVGGGILIGVGRFRPIANRLPTIGGRSSG